MATLHVLGAGTPSPTPERWGTAFALEVGDDVLMIDCGPAATHKLVQAGLRPTDVGWLFFTHHHSDHNVDYPCLVLTRWDHCVGGEPALRVIGPPPTEAITQKLFGPDGVFADDLRARIEHPASHRVHTGRGGSLPRPGLRVEARDVQPGTAIEVDGWRATCAEVDHMEPWLRTFAWRIDWPGGSVCFTGDTRPCEPLADLAMGVDLLVANAPLRQENMHPDLASCIFGTLDAAEAARDAGAGRLLLVHLTPGLAADRERALAEMAEVYPGEIIFGKELMRLEL